MHAGRGSGRNQVQQDIVVCNSLCSCLKKQLASSVPESEHAPASAECIIPLFPIANWLIEILQALQPKKSS